jgi:hypothetical protein
MEDKNSEIELRFLGSEARSTIGMPTLIYTIFEVGKQMKLKPLRNVYIF